MLHNLLLIETTNYLLEMCIGDTCQKNYEILDASELYNTLIYVERAELYRDCLKLQRMGMVVIERIAFCTETCILFVKVQGLYL